MCGTAEASWCSCLLRSMCHSARVPPLPDGRAELCVVHAALSKRAVSSADADAMYYPVLLRPRRRGRTSALTLIARFAQLKGTCRPGAGGTQDKGSAALTASCLLSLLSGHADPRQSRLPRRSSHTSSGIVQGTA